MIYLGIDPGGSGAIAAVGEHIRPSFIKNESTEREIAEWLSAFPPPDSFAIIEKVSSSPQMGVSSAFTFGRSYGFLRGLLICAKIPFEEVSPQRWQKAMQCRTGGDKNVSKAKASQLFPELTITHAIADALLLAEYNRRLRAGMFNEQSPRRERAVPAAARSKASAYSCQ
jgi:hypothetical protein